MLDFYKKNIVLQKKCQGVLPTNMLKYLVNKNASASDLYMVDIANMIFWFCQYFDQP